MKTSPTTDQPLSIAGALGMAAVSLTALAGVFLSFLHGQARWAFLGVTAALALAVVLLTAQAVLAARRRRTALPAAADIEAAAAWLARPDIAAFLARQGKATGR